MEDPQARWVVYKGKSIDKWMMTAGTPMTKRKHHELFQESKPRQPRYQELLQGRLGSLELQGLLFQRQGRLGFHELGIVNRHPMEFNDDLMSDDKISY